MLNHFLLGVLLELFFLAFNYLHLRKNTEAIILKKSDKGIYFHLYTCFQYSSFPVCSNTLSYLTCSELLKKDSTSKLQTTLGNRIKKWSWAKIYQVRMHNGSGWGDNTRWKKTEQLWLQLISHMSNSHSFNLTVPSFLLCKLGAWNRWPWRFSILNLILYNSEFSAHPVQQMIYSSRPISTTPSLKRFSMVQLLELYFPSS